MFQDPKGYMVQMCEEHLQHENSTTVQPAAWKQYNKMAVFQFFKKVNFTLFLSILFGNHCLPSIVCL